MAKSKPGTTPKATAAKTTAHCRQSAAPAEAPKTGRGGLARPVTPSPELGAIVGTEPLSRAELTQRVGEYINRHDLQDANDRLLPHILRPAFALGDGKTPDIGCYA